MTRKQMITTMLSLSLCALTLLAGCRATTDPVTEQTGETAATETAETAAAADPLQANGIFTERDLLQTADLTGARELAVADGETLEITEEGVYAITGSAENCTIRINAADDAKVQLVLCGVSVTNGSTPAICLVNADKLFVTTAEDTENTLTVTGAFAADGEIDPDAVIFGKDDMVFNGTGSLTIVSAAGSGIAGKDDLKFTGGTYAIEAAKHGIEANDSIAVCGGSFSIEAGEDGLHAENGSDDALGWIYLNGADMRIDVTSDAIHGTSVVQIDGGSYTLSGREGVEGTYIVINGGRLTIEAEDDCINAGAKSDAYAVKIEINGGEIDATVAQGDTDAIDSNGDIEINGGSISVTASGSAFDYDGEARLNGGTVTINGQVVNEIVRQ